jgi:hypothetical protein
VLFLTLLIPEKDRLRDIDPDIIQQGMIDFKRQFDAGEFNYKQRETELV